MCRYLDPGGGGESGLLSTVAVAVARSRVRRNVFLSFFLLVKWFVWWSVYLAGWPLGY